MDSKVEEAVRSIFEALEEDSSTKDKHLDALINVMVADLVKGGIDSDSIVVSPSGVIGYKPDSTVPGWFRPTKNWDIVLYHGDELMGVIELKTLTKSVAKNVNNRVEESIGSPFDLTTASIEGLIGKLVRKPIKGYVMVIPSNDETEKVQFYNKSNNPASRFEVDAAFEGQTKATLFTVSGKRLLQKGIYDAVWVVKQTDDGKVIEPDAQLTYAKFIKTFVAENMIRDA